MEKVNDLLTVQSGVYSYLKGEKIDNKTRGFAAGNGAAMGGADLEAIERRMELEGVPDKARKMLTFREALLDKVPAAWRQAAFKPDGSVNLSPEIILMLRTFITAGAAVASRDRFDLIGRWANVPKKLSVHTPGPKRRLLTPDDCDGDAERVFRMYWTHKGKEAARCRELVPTAPSRPEGDTWRVMSRPHIPKWYEGEAELTNDWVSGEDLDGEDILLGDQ